MSEVNVQSCVKNITNFFKPEYLRYIHPALFLTIKEGYEIINHPLFVKTMIENNIFILLEIYNNTTNGYKMVKPRFEINFISDDIGTTSNDDVYSKSLDSFFVIDYNKLLDPVYMLENNKIIKVNQEDRIFLSTSDFDISSHIIDKMIDEKIISTEKYALYCN